MGPITYILFNNHFFIYVRLSITSHFPQQSPQVRVIPSIHMCVCMLFEPRAITTSLVSWMYGDLGRCV